MKEKLKRYIKKLNNINKKYRETISKKPFQYIFNFLPQNIFLLLLLLYALFLFIPQIKNNNVRIYSLENYDSVIEEIYDSPVEQTILQTKQIDSFDTIGILFATYARTNHSIYQFQLYENDQVIYQEKFKAKDLEDNAYKYFDTGKVKINKAKKYKFSITPLQARKGQGITIYANTKEKNNQLAYNLTSTSEFYNIVILLSICFLIIFCIINYFINNQKITTEKKFLLTILAYIIPLLFIIPAFQIPDEVFHFYKAYNLSTYNILKSPAENLTKKTIQSPKNIDCLNYSNLNGSDNVTSVKEYLSCYQNTKSIKMKSPVNQENKNFVAYIPAAIAIRIADVFTNSPMILFYIGRIMNLLVSLSLILLAIKVIPKHKKVLLMVACIPMFIQQLISYSYDSLLNACCLLLIAYIIKFINDKEKISRKEFQIFILLSFLILEIKAPYAILSALIIMVPKTKFESKKEKIKKIIILAISILILYLLTELILSIGYIPLKEVTEKSQPSQLHYLITHPIHLLKVIINTFRLKGIWYLDSLIGIFGWLKFRLDKMLVISYYIVLILVLLAEKSQLKRNQRLIIITTVLIIAGGIFAAMYFGWSAYKLPYVEGVQGRYFIPLLVPFMLAVMPREKKLKIENKTIYTFINIEMITVIVTLLIAYY